MKDKDILYTRDHLWVVPDSTGLMAYIGLSEHASRELEGVGYVELGISRRVVKRGGTLGSVESTKTASDLVCPFDCEVADVHSDISNGALNEHPEEMSSWLYVVHVQDKGWRDGLMTPEEYAKYIGGGDETDKA